MVFRVIGEGGQVLCPPLIVDLSLIGIFFFSFNYYFPFFFFSFFLYF